MLHNVQVVGLDAEWKPNTSGEQNPISILQVCLSAHLSLARTVSGMESIPDLVLCQLTVSTSVVHDFLDEKPLLLCTSATFTSRSVNVAALSTRSNTDETGHKHACGVAWRC